MRIRHHEHREQVDRISSGARSGRVAGGRPAPCGKGQALSSPYCGGPRSSGISHRVRAAEGRLRPPGGAHRHIEALGPAEPERTERELSASRAHANVSAGPPRRGITTGTSSGPLSGRSRGIQSREYRRSPVENPKDRCHAYILGDVDVFRP